MNRSLVTSFIPVIIVGYLAACTTGQETVALTIEPAEPEPTNTTAPDPLAGVQPTMTSLPETATLEIPDGIVILSADYFSDLNYDVFALDSRSCLASGGCQREDLNRLTDRPGFVLYPVWSPDGTRIAFVSEEELGGAYMFVMDADGGRQEQVSAETGSAPAWSPDGGRIAFHRDGDAEGGGIYVLTLDNGLVDALLVESGVKYLYPSWSPAGDEIAYISNRDGDFEIVIYDVLSGASRSVTDNTVDEFAPRYSPNGDKLAYVVFDDGGRGDIHVCEVDGWECSQLTDSPEGDNFPSWSRDGSAVIFWSTRGGGGLFYIAIDDGEVVPLLYLDGSLGGIGISGAPGWQP